MIVYLLINDTILLCKHKLDPNGQKLTFRIVKLTVCM